MSQPDDTPMNCPLHAGLREIVCHYGCSGICVLQNPAALIADRNRLREELASAERLAEGRLQVQTKQQVALLELQAELAAHQQRVSEAEGKLPPECNAIYDRSLTEKAALSQVVIYAIKLRDTAAAIISDLQKRLDESSERKNV